MSKFRDEIKNDLENIKPSEKVISEIRAKTDVSLDVFPEPQPQKRRIGFNRILRAATAACLAVAICTVGIFAAKRYIEGDYGTTEGENRENSHASAEIGNKKPIIVNAEDYDEIFEILKSRNYINEFGGGLVRGESFYSGNLAYGEQLSGVDGAPGEVTGDKAVSETLGNEKDTEKNDGEGNLDYSDTNLQVVGVQEADVIKTDGKYIYAFGKEGLYIVKVDKGLKNGLEVVSHLEISKETKEGQDNLTKRENALQIYLAGDRLIVIKQICEYEVVKPNNGQENVSAALIDGSLYYDSIGGYYNYKNTTYTAVAEVFDISDRANPKSLGEIGQTGSYLSSRMIGEKLYLISSDYPHYYRYIDFTTEKNIYSAIKKDDPSTYIPKTVEHGIESVIRADDVYILDDESIYGSTVVSCINVSDGASLDSSAAVFGSVNEVYCSTENLYMVSTVWSSWQDSVTGDGDNASGNGSEETSSQSQTRIIRVSLDGEIKVAAEGKVDGEILNQFSMDEHDGYFRIVTTSSVYRTFGGINQTNGLYVLDKELKVVGSITGLAETERVYSVRFDGDIAYFVTFRQTDPLYSVDLSDPNKPAILGALKIPGFSDYLHKYSDTLLFGLGFDADENGSTNGLKISMFDISDKSDVTEKHKLVLSDYWYSEASYNHKAILVAPEKNLICIPAENSFLVFEYDEENGFTQKTRFEASKSWYSNDLRSLYIGGELYFYTNTGLTVYSLESFEEVGKIRFSDDEFNYSVYGENASLDEYLGDESVKEIAVPENYKGFTVTSIGTRAFEGLKSLEKVTIPKSVTYISDYTFFDCTSLKTVDIKGDLDFIASFAFANTAIEELSINGAENGKLVIDSMAFGNCRNLKKVTFGDRVSFICIQAFAGCKNLTEIVFEGDTNIDEGSFDFMTEKNAAQNVTVYAKAGTNLEKLAEVYGFNLVIAE